MKDNDVLLLINLQYQNQSLTFACLNVFLLKYKYIFSDDSVYSDQSNFGRMNQVRD